MVEHGNDNSAPQALIVSITNQKTQRFKTDVIAKQKKRLMQYLRKMLAHNS